jgi:hypothetical protein
MSCHVTQCNVMESISFHPFHRFNGRSIQQHIIDVIVIH